MKRGTIALPIYCGNRTPVVMTEGRTIGTERSVDQPDKASAGSLHW
jgi:hypothetical protein